VAGRADLGEAAVSLVELAFAFGLVAVLVREFGELDVDRRLVAVGAGVVHQLLRARQRGLYVVVGSEVLGGEQDAGEHNVGGDLRCHLFAAAQQGHRVTGQACC
jgi:hypothetical protein